ncbi:uncharacterized protein LOC125489517 [Plutella xylostella]|uniref:uncharacterized protein LOC125489517 n=1 Tax=Plutella xylostella TaxID=51655 RepID=UPI00203298FE|nr:uncharacterized protein LOC125489517 [Plutella xylostella]
MSTHTPTSCAHCAENVGCGPQCSACSKKFHFKCGTITERGFERLGAVGRAAWLCPQCRGTPTKSLTEDDAQSRMPDKPQSLVKQQVGTKKTSASSTANQKEATLELISGQISDILSKLSVMTSIQSDIKELKSDISDMKTTFKANMDELTTKVSELDGRVSTLEQLQGEVCELKKTLNEISEDNRRNDQWVRRSNIQINGVPQKSNENLINVVKKLAAVSGFTLNAETDIDFVTRVAVRKDADQKQPKPIILKMQARYKKDDFMAALQKLKTLKASDIGILDSDNRIYINDHLSAHNKFLLQQAKLKSKQKGYTYCWVRNCTVMVRRDATSPVIHVSTIDSLNKIV